MKILLDTSVFVAAFVESHPSHEATLPWLQRARERQAQGYVALHTIAELYATLTRIPLKPPISGQLAQHLIKENILPTFEVITLTAQDYLTVIDHLARNKLVGGVSYDALILYAALKAEVDQIVTLNQRDFGRIYPNLSDKVVSPK